MMRITNRLLAVLASLLIAGAASADPTGLVLQTDEAALMTPAEWTAYSTRISDALASHNQGLQEAALRMTILYADRLSLDRRDTIEMVKVYRNDKNYRMRRLAVVAINAADDHWGIDMLARSYRFEDVTCIRHQIAAVLLDHATRHGYVVIEEEPTVLKVWPPEQ